MKKPERLTIREAITFTGKSESTIYRHIRQGKLKTFKETINDEQVTTIEKLELTKVFKLHASHITVNQQSSDSQVTGTDNQMTMEKMKEAVYQVISEQQSQLMKPLEEQALYRLGILENEVKHLHAEKETLRQENELLKEQVKALPGPAELETKENTILLLQEELKNHQEKHQKEKESTQQVLLENAENMALLQKEKEELLSRGEQNIKELESKLKREKEETEARLLREKEEAIKKHEEDARKQKDELEKKLKAEAEEKARAKAEAEEALKQLKELPAPVESIQQILLDNATNLTKLAKEKESFQSSLKEHEATIREKERALKELEELRKQEMEGLKQQAEEEKARLLEEKEKEKQEIAEAWKKELKLAKKPWWKFWS